MPRRFLLSTPAGLKSLQARQPVITVHGPFGFMSTEVVFKDAESAHLMQAALRDLYGAAMQVQRQLQASRGRLAKQDVTELTGALLKAREWV